VTTPSVLPRPRVAVLVPYWEFWQNAVQSDLRAHLQATATRALEALPRIEPVANELVEAGNAAEVVGRIETAAPDAILVLQLMAVPPARTTAVLDALRELPVVVWGAHGTASPEHGYGHAHITTEGATVGSSQLVSMLVRTRRPFAFHVGRLGDPDTAAAVTCSTLAARTARCIRQGTLARIGPQPDGYDCVVCDPEELRQALGLRLINVPPEELARRVRLVEREAVEALEAEVGATFAVGTDAPTDEGLERSLRFAAALEGLDRELSVSAGAINCHVAELRFAPDIGVAPCFALGRETSRGTPWACAGDMLTAVALLGTKLLGGAALYHELETIDYDAGALVIANTGEHDLAWADPGTQPELRANGWFATDPVCGACACFGPPPGPATLVAFTPHPDEPSGFRFVVAEGSFDDRSFPAAATPNGVFRFRGRDAADGFVAWARAGSNHHSSSTPGLLGDAVAELAGFLEIGCERVS
jgi:L-fucose isomerase-like protein